MKLGALCFHWQSVAYSINALMLHTPAKLASDKWLFAWPPAPNNDINGRHISWVLSV
jgi:hypothetical protein